MEEQIANALIGPLMSKGIVVDSVRYGVDEEEKVNTLYVVIDKVDGDVTIDEVVEATKIINPIVDELDLIKEEYTLDVSSKEKGDN